MILKTLNIFFDVVWWEKNHLKKYKRNCCNSNDKKMPKEIKIDFFWIDDET